MNIYLIIAISCVILFIIILSLIYIFNRNNSNKPLTPPSKNTCPNNLSQCGTGCYDKSKQSCDS